jgi:type IV secretory pathway TraG/TraD family ATPase VirD4
LDELASLEKLASLQDVLTKGRKHGVRVIAGLQSVSQLTDIYGKEQATTLRASFRSLVVLGGSKTDSETAEAMSLALGEHEVARPEYTDSRNPGSARNTSERLVRTTERVVTPAQVQTLPDLTGWIAFSGDRPIAKFVLEARNFAIRNAPFVEAKRKTAHQVARGDVSQPQPWTQVGLPEDPTMAT